MHYFRVLATDYDGTIAHDGVVNAPAAARSRSVTPFRPSRTPPI